MHTYTPTASHDAVVEFDNGDLGNQTNLNSMVRALGNRTELAKTTNDSQAASIATLTSQMLQALNPGYLDCELSMTASGATFSGGENYCALTGVTTGGTAGSPTLSSLTYAGTGGGTKLIRLSGNTKYRVTANVTVLCADGGADGSYSLTLTKGTSTSFDPTLVGAFVRGVALNRGTVSGVGTTFSGGLSAIISNASASALYLMFTFDGTPLVADDYTIDSSSVIVQAIGTA